MNSCTSILFVAWALHHRHRQYARLCAAEETVERLPLGNRGGLRAGQRNGENRVRAELLLAGRTVRFQHGMIDRICIAGVQIHDSLCQRRVDIFHGFQYALAIVALLVAVAKLQRLILARGRAAGARRAARAAVAKRDLRFDGGISTRVHDLAADDVNDLCKFHSKSSNLFREAATRPNVGYLLFLLYHLSRRIAKGI